MQPDLNNQRIDYLRIKLKGDAAAIMRQKGEFEDYVWQYAEPRNATLSSLMNFGSMYDPAAKEWFTTFETWGLCADHVFDVMPNFYVSQVTRIDIRRESSELTVPLHALDELVRRNAGNKRSTITRLTSPIRTKKAGRDAGGDGVYVGSRDSDRRVAVYRRGNEPWAIEAQFSKAMPEQLRQQAYDAWQGQGVTKTLKEAYLMACTQAFEDAVRQKMHYTYDQLAGNEDSFTQDQMLNYQEDLLASIEMQIRTLNDEGRAAIAALMLDISSENEYNIIQPDDLLMEP
jgi:hypothetical protein